MHIAERMIAFEPKRAAVIEFGERPQTTTVVNDDGAAHVENDGTRELPQTATAVNGDGVAHVDNDGTRN